MELNELSRILKESGVAGAGGAGFPSYAKLDKRAETIILNCAECEPLLTLHRQLLKDRAFEIIKALKLIKETLEAKEVIIALKKIYAETIAVVNEYIRDENGFKLCLLEDVYPMGDEVVLIYEATGKSVRAGGLPVEQGVIVFNTETCYNIYKAVFLGQNVTEKLITVTGEVNSPVTVLMPIGATIKEAVSFAGGVKCEKPVYISGGIMTGKAVSADSPITKTTNAVIVLSKENVAAQKQTGFNAAIEIKRAAACCCQCRLCTDLCPRYALGYPIQPHLFMRAATCKDIQDKNIFLDTLYCCSCGLCEMYSCFQGLSPRKLIDEYKRGLIKEGIRAKNIEKGEIKANREYIKIPDERLMSRLDIVKYNHKSPADYNLKPVKRVRIPLLQNIGKAAVPVVKDGDIVLKNSLIAKAAEGALSLNIHSSIDGKVTAVESGHITIEKQK